MKKVLYNKYDKSQISALPRALFAGRIVVVLNAQQARSAVDYLLDQPLLGFDTETRPSFTKGVSYQVSLLQVSTPHICFLFRLKMIGQSSDIIRLLEDRKVKKVGLSWHDDLIVLSRVYSFTPGAFIDIQEMVGALGIKDLSLQKIYANVFGRHISKKEQLSNWERDVLTEQQKRYASTDAWACVQLYEELCRLKKTHDYQLVIREEPQTEIAQTEKSQEDETDLS